MLHDSLACPSCNKPMIRGFIHRAVTVGLSGITLLTINSQQYRCASCHHTLDCYLYAPLIAKNINVIVKPTYGTINPNYIGQESVIFDTHRVQIDITHQFINGIDYLLEGELT